MQSKFIALYVFFVDVFNIEFKRSISIKKITFIFFTEISRLAQIKTILANSTFNINKIVSKTTSDDDDGDDGSDEDDKCIESDDLYEFNDDSEVKNVYV